MTGMVPVLITTMASYFGFVGVRWYLNFTWTVLRIHKDLQFVLSDTHWSRKLSKRQWLNNVRSTGSLLTRPTRSKVIVKGLWSVRYNEIHYRYWGLRIGSFYVFFLFVYLFVFLISFSGHNGCEFILKWMFTTYLWRQHLRTQYEGHV